MVGSHAEDTAEGAMLGPGDSTEDLASFDPDNEHNKRLIDEGVLIPIEAAKSEKSTKKKEG